MTDEEPRILAIAGGAALPSGPFESRHRTLQIGVRSWVERQTQHPLGYVEQLYTFADRDRTGGSGRVVSISYLGLTRETAAALPEDAGVAQLVSLFPVGGLARRAAGAGGEGDPPRLSAWAQAADGRAAPRPPRAHRRQFRRRPSATGTRNWCCSVTSFSTRRGSCPRPRPRGPVADPCPARR